MINDTRDLMVEFASTWARFGGGTTEDIFVTFGLSPDKYYQRLYDLVRTSPGLFCGDLALEIGILCTQHLTEEIPPGVTLI
ncbi:MAG: DUF3263 domain-containing protein [Rhodococcus sp. (in: high G+C Gram-positive bacteria)]